VGFLLAKASQRFNELLVERFAARGFPEVRASYGSVLVPLFERDGLRLGELAAASRLSKQAMTALVRHCEADGLVERQRDPADGRAFNVRLTPRGHALHAVAEDVLGELDDALVGSLGRRNRDALVRALKGVMVL
jgi:DNA-binding MarR family transcriptional regulator